MSKVLQFPGQETPIEDLLETAKTKDFDGIVIIGIKTGDDDDTIEIAGHAAESMSRLTFRGALEESIDMLYRGGNE